MTTTHTPEALADAVLSGIQDGHPELAYEIPLPRLRAACESLPGLGWGALMARRWAEHERWDTATPEDVLRVVEALAVPPERPRSVRPVPQDECPAHPGPWYRHGECSRCVREAAAVPRDQVAARLAEVRAARRPLRTTA